jgi:hypothetical protein
MASTTDNGESSTRTPPADQDWFGGRRWTGIAAIGFLVLLVVCALVVVIARHGRGPGPAVAPPTAQSSVPAAPLPTAVPTTAPAGATWTIYETVALPTLPGAGPAHVDGPIATGYAHTPLGALMAVANESYRYGLADDATWRQAADAMCLAGPGRDAWVQNRGAHPYGPGGGTGGQSLAQIAGFQFVSYTPADTVVQLVTRDSKGNLQVGANHVTWDSGDWRLVLLPPYGSAIANLSRVDNLGGFVEWRGV